MSRPFAFRGGRSKSMPARLFQDDSRHPNTWNLQSRPTRTTPTRYRRKIDRYVPPPDHRRRFDQNIPRGSRYSRSQGPYEQHMSSPSRKHQHSTTSMQSNLRSSALSREGDHDLEYETTPVTYRAVPEAIDSHMLDRTAAQSHESPTAISPRAGYVVDQDIVMRRSMIPIPPDGNESGADITSYHYRSSHKPILIESTPSPKRELHQRGSRLFSDPAGQPQADVRPRARQVSFNVFVSNIELSSWCNI